MLVSPGVMGYICELQQLLLPPIFQETGHLECINPGIPVFSLHCWDCM